MDETIQQLRKKTDIRNYDHRVKQLQNYAILILEDETHNRVNLHGGCNDVSD